VALYLLERGLLRPEQIMDESLTMTAVSRRNTCLRVVTECGECFIIKQPRDGFRIDTLAREADVYGAFEQERNRCPALDHVPRQHAFDADHSVLVLDGLPNHLDLETLTSRRGALDTSTAADVGGTLAKLHTGLSASMHQLPRTADGVVDGPPWPMSLHRPCLSDLPELSPGNLAVIKLAQNFAEFSDLLDGLRAAWSPNAFIHYDFTWSNILVWSRTEPVRYPRVIVVDWELAGLGDARWDVASFIADALCFPLIAGATSHDDGTQGPWEQVSDHVHPGTAAFIAGYCSTACSAVDTRWLLTVLRFSAARLLQTAIELTLGTRALPMPVLEILQMSYDLLRRPEAALALVAPGAALREEQPT
jgi:hypothetical protein